MRVHTHRCSCLFDDKNNLVQECGLHRKMHKQHKRQSVELAKVTRMYKSLVVAADGQPLYDEIKRLKEDLAQSEKEKG